MAMQRLRLWLRGRALALCARVVFASAVGAGCSVGVQAMPSLASRSWTLDLNADGQQAAVSFTFQTHPNEEVPRGRLRVAVANQPPWTSRFYPAWGAWAGDIDGDHYPDILLGIWSYKPLPNQPYPHKTIWVLSWNGKTFFERWRGSALSDILHAAHVADLDGDGLSDLIALETHGEDYRLKVYRWRTFGVVVRAGRLLKGDGWTLNPDAPVVCQSQCFRIALAQNLIHLEEIP